jgi:HPt (histidine-containing phosphotransfer) domain-containing protein
MLLEKSSNTIGWIRTGFSADVAEESVSVQEKIADWENESWPIDMAFVDQMFGPDSEDLLNDLIQLFLEDSPAIIQNIQQALGADDRVTIKSEAHTLKGSSASMGISTLSALCAELEALAMTADESVLKECAQNLFDEYWRIADVLA